MGAPVLINKTWYNALWLAMGGNPMSYASMGEVITETTRMMVGVKVNPHLFRAAGVTTLATRVGNKPHAGGALLHHRPGPVTQENYNRASCISAGKSNAAVTQSYRRKKLPTFLKQARQSAERQGTNASNFQNAIPCAPATAGE